MSNIRLKDHKVGDYIVYGQEDGTACVMKRADESYWDPIDEMWSRKIAHFSHHESFAAALAEAKRLRNAERVKAPRHEPGFDEFLANMPASW